MTDPAGGYGWRAGRGAGPHRRVAERLEPEPRRPLCLLLLPTELERFPLRERVTDLLTGPGVVAVEPARLSYTRLPASVADGVAVVQARRLRLPGYPGVIVVFAPLQYALARALIAQHPDAELWYWPCDPGPEPASRRQAARREELEISASMRAALTLGEAEDAPAGAARERNRPLWERLEAMGIESGRLGSERVSPRSGSAAGRRAAGR